MMVVGLGHGDDRAIPVGCTAETFGDLVGAVVLAVERLRVDAIVDEAGEYGAGDGGGVPVLRSEGRKGDGVSGLGDFGSVLQLPAGGDHDGRRWRRTCRGGKSADQTQDSGNYARQC